MKTLAILLLLASTAYAELPLIDTITYDVPDGISCMAFDVQVSNGELLGVSAGEKQVEMNGNKAVIYSMDREDIQEILFRIRQDKNRFLLKIENLSASNGDGERINLWGFDEYRYKYGAIRGKKVRGDQW